MYRMAYSTGYMNMEQRVSFYTLPSLSPAKGIQTFVAYGSGGVSGPH